MHRRQDVHKPKEVIVNAPKIIGIIGFIIFLFGFNWMLYIRNTPFYFYFMIYGFLLMFYYAVKLMIDGMYISRPKSPPRRILK